MSAGDSARVLIDGHTIALTSLSKVLYPASETTKGEVIHYYVSVAAALLPQLGDRPVTRVRWPDGTGSASFFEKNLPGGAPSWIRTVTLDAPGSRRGERVRYPLVDDVASLVWLANMASLELHAPQWRVVAGPNGLTPASPDRLVIDLDPGAPAGLPECARLALLVRDLLLDGGFTHTVPVTSGSKGLQIYGRPPGDAAAPPVDQAREMAEQLAKAYPRLVVSSMTKSLRRGKVLLDWSQNNPAKTTICPYSLRGKGGRALAAAPRTWAEVAEGANGGQFTQLSAQQVLERLDDMGDLMTLEG